MEGLVDDVGMTGNQYLTGLTLFFIGYILFEVPCNIILKRTTPRFWLPTLTVIWGVAATLLGIVHNLEGFFVARFFLGVAEGGLFPGVVFYLSCWYRRQERQFRVALFFSAASLAGAFGGILAWVSRSLSPWTRNANPGARALHTCDASAGSTAGTGSSSLRGS